MKNLSTLVLVSTLLACAGCESRAAPADPAVDRAAAGPVVATGNDGPVFTADERLLLPHNYREWIFLSAGLDMSYSKRPDAAMHSMFDNVFVDPAAWRSFQDSGHWPDKTILVMEVRGGRNKGSINRRGQFQGPEVMGIEVHVRDTARFGKAGDDGNGWAFFGFDSDQPAVRIPVAADCYGCHRQHAAVDTTFVQFYPTLLPIAQKNNTLSPEYRRESEP